MRCNLCQGQRATPVYTVRGWPLVRCACGLVYVAADLAALDFAALYADRYPPEAFLPQRPRKVAKSHRELARLERLTTGRRLLDIGCSYGFFLDTARQRGWSVAGVEVSASAARFARETYGLPVHLGPLRAAPYAPGSFDVVTIRHVLEHVPDPLGMVLDARRLLAPGGLLLVAVPNFASLAARLFGPDWWWVDPPTHLYYFTRATLSRLLARAGVVPLDYSTERCDDETLAFYLVFVLNQRLGVLRRLRGGTRCAPGADNGVAPRGLPSTRGARLWTVVRRAGELVERLTWPLGTALDRAGLGAEVLVIGRWPAARARAVREPAAGPAPVRRS
ncbi:MAG TPA: class I SAM-dependent methyltransferase [Chloroflexota bacterium]|jgi:SAM-dependent methyltransferase|nr:class I SAM-dependent methyltransferase [Chloroflexota bacterium]